MAWEKSHTDCTSGLGRLIGGEQRGGDDCVIRGFYIYIISVWFCLGLESWWRKVSYVGAWESTSFAEDDHTFLTRDIAFHEVLQCLHTD